MFRQQTAFIIFHSGYCGSVKQPAGKRYEGSLMIQRQTFDLYDGNCLTHFMALVSFDTPRKHYYFRQKQPSRGVLNKGCPGSMQQIYRRTPMPKCDFNFIEITLRHGCSPVNLLYIFGTPFSKNTSGWLLLFRVVVITDYGKFLCVNSADCFRNVLSKKP